MSSFQGPQPPDQLRGWIDSLLDATAGKLGGAGAATATNPSRSTPNWRRRARISTPATSTPRSAPTRRSSTPTPTHDEAKGAVRQIAFLQRAHPHSRRMRLPRADAAPDDIEAAFAAADVEILQQNVAAAFDRLIALVRRTAGDDRTHGPHAADRTVRPVRPGRSRRHRRAAQPRQRAVLTRLSGTGSNHSAASGGSTINADAGRPCHGSSVASTAPKLPMPEPL